MNSGDGGSVPTVRLWWAAPLALVVITAVVFVTVVLPALASSAHVPNQLVVHRSPSSSAPAPTPTPRHTTASPVPTQSTTTVVRPTHPVVRESDDRFEGHGGNGSEGPNDR